MALDIIPSVKTFRATGDGTMFTVSNLTDCRLAFKVKCTNNKYYRVIPVYGFVPKQDKAYVRIVRLDGPPKVDKFVFQWAEVPEEALEPEAPFKIGAQGGEVVLLVNAE